MRPLGYVATFVVGLILAALVTGWRPPLRGAGAGSPVTGAGDVAGGGEVADDIAQSRRTAIVRAVERVSDSVVTIAVNTPRPPLPGPFDDLFQRFVPRLESEWEIGSGLVIDRRGLIVTNNHVLTDASDIWVVLPDGRFFGRNEIEIVGQAPYYDLAVLRLNADTALDAAPRGDSDGLIVGEWVIAIGNPFGFYFRDSRPSVTVGVVSGLGRELEYDVSPSTRGRGAIYKDMIQTDATINPGNSGGPLVNARGEVIGINTFILSSGVNSGLGFAIPINAVEDVVSDIVTYGEVREPWFGLGVSDLTPHIRRHLNVFSTEGVVVRKIEPGSPGETADFRLYDVIYQVNGRPIRNRDAAFREIFGARIGDTVRFGVERDGVEMEIPMVIQSRPTMSARGRDGRSGGGSE